MGNQARVRPQTTVISTSTRNFDDRMGDGARVYLGSAVLSAVAALMGKLPTVEEYMAVMKEKVDPASADIHRYLYFDEMGEFALHYTGAHF
jgi:aconitate hydratase 2/2-methylisocitrate dehydratase